MIDILSLWESLSGVKWAALSAAILAICGFLESVFGVKAVGTWFFKFLRKMFIWLMIPFEPINIVSHFSKRMDNVEKTVAEIKKEVSYNGGGSMKDAVRKLQMENGEKLAILHEIVMRMDMADDFNNRMIFRTDDKGACTYINRSFLTHFGWIERDIEHFNWENIIESEDLPNVREKWKRAIETQSMFRDEHYILKKDGNSELCLVQASPISSQGTFKGFYGVVTIIN